MAAPETSVVLPMYNEEEVVGDCLAEVSARLEQLGPSFEIVCVNDGSSDRTAELLDEHATRDARVVPVHFSRNFGKEAALTAGLEAASGRCVILMDADLQHPPDLLPQMVERWREGYDLVEAVKSDRGRETGLYRLFAKAFYGMMGRAIGRSIEGSSDFKLLDRQVVDALRAFPERNRFFRGLVAWVGFRVARIPFEVQDRRAGHTKWSPRQLVAYSVRNLVAFSSAPLRVVAWAGFATVGVSILFGAQTLFNFFYGRPVSGFTTIILVMVFLSGLMLTSLGVVAIYVASIYDEQKARPLYVVRRNRSTAAGSATVIERVESLDATDQAG